MDEKQFIEFSSMLARIDERTEGIITRLSDLQETSVTKEAFNPVRNITYGLVGLIMTAVITSILALLIAPAL